MRIIAGKAKGYNIKVPQGEVRPTQDRVREALFNIIGPIIQGARVLDLYCGSGSVGLEALSRGAASARMVDAAKNSCNMARQNLEKSKLTGGSVAQSDCLQFVKRDAGKYDIIFADPCRLGVFGPHVIQMAELCDGHLAHAMFPHHLCATFSVFVCHHVVTLSSMTAHKCNPHRGDVRALQPRYE